MKRLIYGSRKIDAYNDFSLVAPAYYDTLINSLTIEDCKTFLRHNLSKDKRKMLLDNISDGVLQTLLCNKIIRISEVSENRLEKYLLNDSQKRSLFFPLIWENCNLKEKYNLLRFIFSEPGLESFSNIVLNYERNHQLLVEFLTELSQIERENALKELIRVICKGLDVNEIVWQFFEKKIKNRKIVKQFLEVLKEQEKLIDACKYISTESKVDFLCDFDFFVLRTLKEKIDVMQELKSEEVDKIFANIFNKKIKLPEVFTPEQIRRYYLAIDLSSEKINFLKKVLKELDTMQCKVFFKGLQNSEKLQVMGFVLDMSENICIKQMIVLIGVPETEMEVIVLQRLKEKIKN